MTDTPKPTVLITGASSGFGNLTCRRFQREGWNVIATMRSPEKEAELNKLENVLITRLDVTDQPSIDVAVQQGNERFGRIDALVNNAGYGAFGFLEEASPEEVRLQMDTNFFGVVKVTQAVLPHMRERRSGVIINVTSVSGLIGQPMLSLYSASKFAVEGLSESLRHELKEFGITVKLVEPGSFKTGFAAAHAFTEGKKIPELNRYRETYREFLANMMEKPPRPFGFGDPQDVAEVIYRCVTNPRSRFRNPVGRDAKMLLTLRMVLPERSFFSAMQNAALPQYGQ